MSDFRKYIELLENAEKDSSRFIEVYHGDNFNTTQLEPRLMNNGNNQEGIGIYFSDRYETTKSYGRDVIKAKIDMNRFVPSRNELESIDMRNGVVNVLHDMNKVDPESMFYLLTDYGVFVTEPEDVTAQHISDLYQRFKNEQIRNFQVTMAQTFNVIDFVESWNTHIKIDGTYERNSATETWFAIINPNIKVDRV